MKKHYAFILFAIVFFSADAQTNVYHPFPDTNAIWAFRGWNIYNLPGHNGEWRYAMRGDTSINGKSYKKIYSIIDTTIMDLPYEQSTYYAAIREQNKRVYIIIHTSQEQLLYDFNLSIGDTITYYHSLMGTEPYQITTDTFSRVVTAIDSILLLDGKYRKRWALQNGKNCSHPDVVVEGIGSINWYGLFNPLVPAIITNGDQFEFTCFKNNDTTLFIGNTLCHKCFCYLLTGIDNVEDKQIQIKISPNPTSGQFQIQANSHQLLANSQIEIYNVMGEKVYSKTQLPQSTQLTINLSAQAAGIYFLQLKTEQGVATKKLVINK